MTRPPLRNILYVEDNPNIRALAKIALEKIGGFTVRLCESGPEALAAIDAGTVPDLLLLDVMLPGMDGPTILERLRQWPPTARTPAIFMTAKARSAEIAHLMSLGALGVITKPFQPTLLANDIQRLWNLEAASVRDDREIQARLEGIRVEFLEKLPTQLDALRQCVRDIRQAPGEKQWNALHHVLHGLSGTAGSFGFEELGARARRIEELLRSSIAAGAIEYAGEAVTTAVNEYVRWSEAQVNAPAAPPQPLAQQQEIAPPVSATSSVSHLLYLVSGTSDENNLATQLAHFGHHVMQYHALDDLVDAVAEGMPSSIVIDVDTQSDWTHCCEAIAGIKDTKGGKLCAVIFMSASGDFTMRLSAAKAGVDGFFVKPVDVTLMTELLSELTKQRDDNPYRVLIVDDDMTSAEHCQVTLQAARIESTILSKPEQIFQSLDKYRPEIILMDLYMPECSGADLAKLIRQDRTYLDIPIVFLSSEQNPDRQTEAVQSGADYFLTKPITPARLVSAISSRAERYRGLRGLIMRDSLTGLYNHAAIKEHLQREVARAKRSSTPLTIAMIDLDHFKSINDTHGHLAGDQVIRALARLMQARFRRGDMIGRYGGEEFLAILPSTSADAAFGVLDDIRQAFSRICHRTAHSEWTATFSAGVAALRDHPDSEILIRSADARLYSAKDEGRNRVVCD